MLPAVGVGIAPRLLGLHQDEAIWPYPFLELTRIPGTSWDTVADSVAFEDAADCLERLGRQIARWHQVATPVRFRPRPGYLGAPRLGGAWTDAGAIGATVDGAAALLSPHLPDARPQVWEKALRPVAALDQVTVHGELSDGQVLVDGELRITGVVDWDGLHAGHPLLGLDFGVGTYRVFPVHRAAAAGLGRVCGRAGHTPAPVAVRQPVVVPAGCHHAGPRPRSPAVVSGPGGSVCRHQRPGVMTPASRRNAPHLDTNGYHANSRRSGLVRAAVQDSAG